MKNFREVNPKRKYSDMEREQTKFWEENKIFKKQVESKPEDKLYSFYDGPPFATGTPHYGHIVASVMKDAVPRYWAMKGFRVERRWGWDCHGLPVENIAEKDLGIKRKKEIEEMGVEKFNEACRAKVMSYVGEWKKVVEKLGRWADMENDYKTMDPEFMESVWWTFKQLWEKGLIYEGYRSMHICPRCETTLSQQEVSEGYKDIKDLSAVAKFELVDEPGTFLLAWTTTPWTLIGNVALAVNPEIDYCRIQKSKIKNQNDNEKSKNIEVYIVAKDRIEDLIKDEKYEIISEFKGSDVVGLFYKPLFDYYSKQENLENREQGWKVYGADFVTTEEGTGIVHIAPAFGEDDMNLGKEKKLPFVQHVGIDGIIKKEAEDFSGMDVKPSDNHQQTDIEIIKYLAHNNLLFSKEKYEHSYPHCWRCDTPLINYATSSWFVAIEKIKEQMLANAKDINWEPPHLKKGRWGNWLEGARDWSISRQRYWASVMPIWRCEKCEKTRVVGSVDEIGEHFGSPNKLFLVRHGEAESNVQEIGNSLPEEKKYPLTNKGKNDVEELTEQLKDHKIDAIFCSPLTRTKETAEIISSKNGAEIIIDERLRETDLGEMNDADLSELRKIYPDLIRGLKTDKHGIEGYEDIKERVESFLNEVNEKYKNKKIVIVSHGDPLWVMDVVLKGKNIKDIAKGDYYPAKGKAKFYYSRKIDLHKHVVDKITFPCEKCQGQMKRIPDVLDTWFDSGSMPYAQAHYPFENKEKFEKSFPAEFIAEGIDQTRAWFYYLHAIATGIFNKRAFNNVIVNGIVLAEDGKKMAKKLQNYPDPTEMMEKYGADVLRFYLLSSPVVKAQNLNFSEKELAEFSRGMFRMIQNSYSFFVLYANIDDWKPEGQDTRHKKQDTKNLLDKWILSELNVLIKNVNEAMENYELNKATRFFPEFVDNLSNWYIRRSRRRFWKSESDDDKNDAYQTLWTVLVEFSRVLAPFCPFVSEEIYRNLSFDSQMRGLTGINAENNETKESVHLCDYPKYDENLIDNELNERMAVAREIIKRGLELRAEAKIKVRQPLPELQITNYKLHDELIKIIKEEVNVKEVIINEEVGDIQLGTQITPELKLEGQMREVVRAIQQARKEADFQVDDRIEVYYQGGEKIFEKHSDEIKREVLADKLEPLEKTQDADIEKEAKVDDLVIRLWLKK